MARSRRDDKISIFSKSKQPVDFLILITVLILLATGIIMVLSASSPTAMSETGNSYGYVYRQAFSAAIRSCCNGSLIKS